LLADITTAFSGWEPAVQVSGNSFIRSGCLPPLMLAVGRRPHAQCETETLHRRPGLPALAWRRCDLVCRSNQSAVSRPPVTWHLGFTGRLHERCSRYPCCHLRQHQPNDRKVRYPARPQPNEARLLLLFRPHRFTTRRRFKTRPDSDANVSDWRLRPATTWECDHCGA
jgi:hypothetical protein